MAADSLRLRILLFFALLGLGSLAILAAGLYIGHGRAGAGATSGFINAGLIAGFGIAGLTVGIWLLFDENIAKPIERLAADLRTRAHTDVDREIDHAPAKYLGDLGQAAAALSTRLGDSNIRAAEQIAVETARLTAEREQLTAVLSEIPVAVMTISPDHRIVLYDGQAAHALEPVRPLCLGHSIFEYLESDPITRGLDELAHKHKSTAELRLSTADGTRVFDATLRLLGENAGYMLTLQTEPDATAQRPLVFDFDLFDSPTNATIRDTPLSHLAFVVFDTETTGLLPEKDEVVQIGAVRVMNGRLVEGETFDMLVNPGRKIPATSTAVHGISDDMVAHAPTMATVGHRFHQFARDAVLCAHNAPFDMAFMQRWAKGAGETWDNPVMDTVLLSAVLFGGSAEHTLDAIAERLAVTIPEVVRHTALGDAYATAAVLLKMLPMLEARGFSTFGAALHEMQKHTRILPDLNTA
ncbi:MAG: exonuclease domain-containing protein, partial [Pseudomonadota bacterium]